VNGRYSILPLSVVVLLLGAGAVSFAATKPKPKPKLGTIGTAQLPGEWCKFGQAYTLGQARGSDANAMNVTLKSAEYTIGHVKVGDRGHGPRDNPGQLQPSAAVGGGTRERSDPGAQKSAPDSDPGGTE